MSLPGNLTTITVTGTYTNPDGSAASGKVSFTPSVAVVDGTGKVIIPASTISVTLSGSGTFSVVLPCTDNSALSPSNWTWNINVSVTGVAGPQSVFSVFLPSSLGTTVDISALTSAGNVAPAPVSILNSNNTWTGSNTFSNSIAMSGQKITGLGNGSAATDAAAFGQVMGLVATTGTAGTALINGSQTISSWTAPSDGKMHRVLVFGIQNVSSAETGGAVNVSLTMPDGNAYSPQIFGGNAGLGGHNMSFDVYLVQSGSVFSITQTGALSVGAATMWFELWAS